MLLGRQVVSTRGRAGGGLGAVLDAFEVSSSSILLRARERRALVGKRARGVQVLVTCCRAVASAQSSTSLRSGFRIQRA